MIIYKCGWLMPSIKTVEKGALFILECSLHEEEAKIEKCKKCDMKIRIVEK
jgi:hypothetical protein